MNLFPVFNFIVQHFVQDRIFSVLAINCWDVNSQFAFLRYANNQLLRTQLIDINKDFEFPGRFLNGNNPVLGIFLDLECIQSKRIVNVASELQLFINQYNWLIIDGQLTNLEFHELFDDVMMSIDAQVTYSEIDKNYSKNASKSFLTYDVYNNGKSLGGKLNITVDKKMICDAKNCETEYLSDLHLRTKYGNRCNLNDTTFRISTVVTEMPINSSSEEIHEFLLSTNNSHVDTISRYGFKLTMLLKELMNFKVRYIYTSTWSTNETFGGAFGDVKEGKTEIGSTPFLLTTARLKYMTFILRTGEFRPVFLFRTPRNEGLYGGVFLSPFSPSLWISFAVLIVIFTVLLWVVFIIEIRIVSSLKYIPSILSTFLISFGLACSQGAALIPQTIGGRITFFSLSAAAFIMYNYYTSTVVSSLVGSPLKSNIKTIGQLADSSLDVALEPLPYTFAYLNVSTSPNVKKFVRKKLLGRLDQKYSLNAEEGVLRVKEGGFAYQSDASTAYWFVEKYYKQHELCDLNEVKLRQENTLATILHKNSTYKEIIRLRLIRMLETGVISRHRRYWMETKLSCFANSILIYVGLEYTGPLFVFLGIVYIFTFLVLFLEIVWHKCMQN